MFKGFAPDEKGIIAYNQNIEELKKEYANDKEFVNYLKTINGLDDVFTPYSEWLKDTKNYPELGFVHDDESLDFSNFFVCRDYNDYYLIDRLTDHYKCKRLWLPYGVSDNATQIIKSGKIPNDCVVLITPVFKNSKEPFSGWRWHKWGPYYGIKEHKHEYLNDEENIEYVYCFNIVKVKPKTQFFSISDSEADTDVIMKENGYHDLTPNKKYFVDKVFMKCGSHFRIHNRDGESITLEKLTKKEAKIFLGE